ncbi:MAG TPA: hypothetical protein VF138_13185 [Caulobacteraceae bacterium]
MDAWSVAKNVLAIASPFLLLGMGGVGALYKMERDRRRDIEVRLNEKKAQIYSDFIQSYSKLFFRENGRDLDQKKIWELVNSTASFARQALIYASDDVVRKFHAFYRLQLTPPDPQDSLGSLRERIRAFADLVRAMRRELGHSGTRLDTDTVGGILVTDYEPERRR